MGWGGLQDRTEAAARDLGGRRTGDAEITALLVNAPRAANLRREVQHFCRCRLGRQLGHD